VGLARLVFVNRRFEVPLLFSSNRPANHVTGDCANHVVPAHTGFPYKRNVNDQLKANLVLTIRSAETWCRVKISRIARVRPRFFWVPGRGENFGVRFTRNHTAVISPRPCADRWFVLSPCLRRSRDNPLRRRKQAYRARDPSSARARFP